MVFQLPSAVDADAAGVIFYSFVCLIANILLVWLTWTHNDRTSYIACIAYATLIVTMTSIAQQFYDYAYWRDILTDQFYYARDNADNAEVQYHKGSRGVKLILSYIRIFGFTIESTFVFFFALSLAASVYGWFATTPRTTRTISIIGRVLPFILTALTVGLMHSPVAQGSFLVYMVIANSQFVLSLLGSAILLLMILFKYVHSRRNLQTWNVLYGNAASLTSSNAHSSKSRSVWLGSSGGGRSRAYSGAGANNTYDSWLVIRLSIAFAVLCVFEYTNVIPRIAAASHTVDSADDLAPDLSVKRALSSVRGYVSGVTPSLVAFLVFGTTKTFQRKIYETFIPKRFQRKRKPRKNLSISLGNSRPSPHMPASQRPVQQVDEFSLNDMNPKFTTTVNYSPQYPNDGNVSPRVPHGAHSNSRVNTPSSISQQNDIKKFIFLFNSNIFVTMVVVAVAGGTGSVGKTIVEQLQLSQKHEVIVLGRKIPSKSSADAPHFVEANYEDVDSLIKLLESHNVDTIINAIILHEGTLQAQLNLIEAADKSKNTRRFIPSEFGVITTPDLAETEPDFAALRIKSADALKASGLQYTRFVNGFMMDYWGMPNIKTNMAPYAWAVDAANRRAAIPGSGDYTVSLTYSVDLARFIVRSLDSQDWPEWSVLAGSDLTINQLLAATQKVRGDFHVVYDAEEKLRNNEATLLVGDGNVAREWVDMTAQFGRFAVDGRFHMPLQNRLNDKYPDIHPMTIERLLREAWTDKP
ncbi:glycoside hydrolase [Colletotrichum karsti]|uniref:Glycoside hydrolase n=1 Tax=Colletotrichum karsti TaxID=1095194 RepID=A0A9P6HZM9_9PEZI|nr:glycoside hydrolase [Colletotrichum karsti]KAF9872126.1 glycoside hydrolase [Colletotrichum karsti]